MLFLSHSYNIPPPWASFPGVPTIQFLSCKLYFSNSIQLTHHIGSTKNWMVGRSGNKAITLLPSPLSSNTCCPPSSLVFYVWSLLVCMLTTRCFQKACSLMCMPTQRLDCTCHSLLASSLVSRPFYRKKPLNLCSLVLRPFLSPIKFLIAYSMQK